MAFGQDSPFDRPTPFTGSPYSGDAGHNLAGFPGADSLIGQFLKAILDKPITQFLKDAGFVPGAWQPFNNTYGQFQQRQFAEAHDRVMRDQTLQDIERRNYMQTARGLAAAAGVDWDLPAQTRAFNSLAAMQKMSPFLAQAYPDALDALAGPRGSPIGLASRVHLGGRYAIDPVTGQQGLSAESSVALSRGIYDRLYGPGADVGRMLGIGATGAGALYDEMQRRGLGIGLAPERQFERMTPGQRPGSVSAAELQKRIADNPALETQLRGFDAIQTADRLRNLAGAVTAMKEIFGELGQDAPFPKIIQALNSLTQGGLATMPPGKVEDMVRQTWQLAKAAGVGVETVQAVTQFGADQADQFGIPRPFVPQATMGALAFSAAYAGVGGGGAPAWGRAGREQMMLADQSLRLGFSKSTAGMQLGATLRIAELTSGFQPGSSAQKMLEAIQAPNGGNTEFTDAQGRTRSLISVGPQEWAEMMQAGTTDPQGRVRVSATEARRMRSDTTANQEFLFNANLQGLGRRLQAEDVKPFIQAGFGGVIGDFLQRPGSGVSREEALNARRVAGAAVAKAFFEIPPDIMAASGPEGRAKRDQEFARIMKEALLANPNVSPQVLTQLTDQKLTDLGSTGFSNMENILSRDPHTRDMYREAKSGVGFYDRFNPRTLEQTARGEKQAAAVAEMEKLLAPLNVYGPFRRAINALQRGEDMPVDKFLAEVGGAVPADDIRKLVEAQKGGRTEEMKPLIENLLDYARKNEVPLEAPKPGEREVEKLRSATGIKPSAIQQQALMELLKDRGGAGFDTQMSDAQTLLKLQQQIGPLTETDANYKKFLEEGPAGKLIKGAMQDGQVDVDVLIKNIKHQQALEKEGQTGMTKPGSTIPEKIELSGTVKMLADGLVDMRGSHGSAPGGVVSKTGVS